MSIEATVFRSTNHPKYSAVQISGYQTDCWVVRDTSGRTSFYDIGTNAALGVNAFFKYGDIRDYRMPKDVALNILDTLDRIPK